jgi:hypothetical protein
MTMGKIDLNAKIVEWRKGADGFFRWLDDVKPMIPSEKGGFEPFVVPNEEVREAIRQALDGGFSTVVFCWPRRHGKTVVSALIIAWRFLTRRTQTVAIVANSERQSVDTAFKLVKTILEQTAYPASLAKDGRIKIGADSIAYEMLGNIIQGYPANAASLYGKKLSVAQVSELHAARTDTVYQTLASSTIDTEDGLVLVDSTVGSRSSPLYALALVAERGEDPTLFFSHIEYRDLEDAVARGPSWIAPAKLRSRAAQMLPAEFAQQHLNQWTAASNALFPPAIIDLCRGSYAIDVPTLVNGAAYAVGGGLDRAYGFSLHGDSTVATCVLKVLQGEDEHFYVLASDAIKFSAAAGIKKALTRYHRDFGMSRAAIETYNAQDIAAWCGEQPFDHELVSATLERQANAFTALYNAATEGRLHIHPAHDRLLAEMGTFEYMLVANGAKGAIPRFEHAKGQHDDHVYSLAWAVYALREIELNPYEIPGIHCDAVGRIAPLCILNGGELTPFCAEECRSFSLVNALYQKYRDRAGIAPLLLPDFVRYKLINTGSHTVRR